MHSALAVHHNLDLPFDPPRMGTHLGISLATLDSIDGATFSIGWKPRRARAAADRYADDAWLRVHGRVRCSRGAWTFADPALVEAEALELVQWLRRRPWPADDTLDFVEPCLAFRARGAEDGLLHLSVRFMAEVSPPWIRDDDHAVWQEGWTLDMTVREHQLQRLAGDLQRMLEDER